MNILLINDDALYLEHIREMLFESRDSQYKLESVNHLRAAQLCIRKGNYDVILITLCLPDSQGLDTF